MVQASYEQGKSPLILLLDGITDVRNFGAIVRTAACTSVDAIVIPSESSASVSGEAMKTSAGALAHLPICRVGSLKDLDLPLAIILGAEDQGIALQHLEMADKNIHIPMFGPIASLNVSVAAAIILYEHVRQQKFKC